jgi:6-phosphogluconolactonase
MSAGASQQRRIFASPQELAVAAADWVLARALQRRDRFAMCLSGGETPKQLYELLASPEYRSRFPWKRTHFFWGDERFVPPADPRSNFHMTRQAMLSRVPVPAENVHPIPTERITAAAGAAEYETILKRFYGAETLNPARPLFDLTLLGLGEDGHIASLFPGSAALAEEQRWAVPAIGAGGLQRITLTYPAIASSAAVAFLVVGDRKREILARALAGDPELPVSRLHPVGSVYWFADRAAAASPAFSGE